MLYIGYRSETRLRWETDGQSLVVTIPIFDREILSFSLCLRNTEMPKGDGGNKHVRYAISEFRCCDAVYIPGISKVSIRYPTPTAICIHNDCGQRLCILFWYESGPVSGKTIVDTDHHCSAYELLSTASFPEFSQAVCG